MLFIISNPFYSKVSLIKKLVIKMTAQIPDSFIYKDGEYSIVGLGGDGLVYPDDYNLKLQAASTACWRGYVYTYEIVDNKLILKEMLCRLQEESEFLDKKPIKSKKHFFSYKYELDYPVKFTGSFLIARDFIQEMYVHMGYQRPMSFREVIKLEFKEGNLTSEEDLSRRMEDQRNEDVTKDAQPRSPSDEDISSWINKTFSLEHDE